MHIIRDVLKFKKSNDVFECCGYELTVDEKVIESHSSNHVSSSNIFKRQIIPSLVKVGFDKVQWLNEDITVIRERHILNENFNVIEFLHTLTLIKLT